ncbi:DUF6770 family protein [Chitinophaga caseinilytica]|uniref:DUF6770 family protein n=1 Tax=Chitinophaga caseinilytica TaxID=2267521 RepID=A0ABZ2ZEV3_9BACT
MFRNILFLFLINICCIQAASAQKTLSLNDAATPSILYSSGTIQRNNQIGGYYFLMQSDRVDKTTNAYLLHVLDENLNRVRKIKFDASTSISLQEAAASDSSMAFLFYYPADKKYELRIYDNDGKLLQSYTRAFDSHKRRLHLQNMSLHNESEGNRTLFEVGDQGYMAVFVRWQAKGTCTYDINFYESRNRKTSKFSPGVAGRDFLRADFLAKTDSLLFVEVSNRRASRSSSTIMAFNIHTRKKAFEVNANKEKWQFEPAAVLPVPGQDTIVMVGKYFEKDVKHVKSNGKGIAIYRVSRNTGAILTRTYNSWETEISRQYSCDKKGQNAENGYLYLHNATLGPDGKLFVAAEGYYRRMYAYGFVHSTVFLPFHLTPSFTRVQNSDMVVLEFNPTDKLVKAITYDKAPSTMMARMDFLNRHMVARNARAYGLFGYRFIHPAGDPGHFSVCYYNGRKSGEEKGYFTYLRYNGQKFRQYEVPLRTKEVSTSVLPAKPGFLLIIEDNRKERTIEMRMEKIS